MEMDGDTPMTLPIRRAIEQTSGSRHDDRKLVGTPLVSAQLRNCEMLSIWSSWRELGKPRISRLLSRFATQQSLWLARPQQQQPPDFAGAEVAAKGMDVPQPGKVP